MASRKRAIALLATALLGAACSRHRQVTAPDGDASVAVAQQRQEPLAFEHVALDAGGRPREYLLRVPSSVKAGTPSALVISLHGGGGHAEGVDGQTGWSVLGEREGFVLAFPNGIGKSWNDGREDTPSAAVRENVDDVAFLAALVEDVAKRTPIDRKRVFMNGISNGAFMTARFACEHAELVGAIGLVAATAGPDVLARCKPARRMSLIAFSGDADPIVPFAGGVVKLGPAVRGKAVSFAESIRFWTAAASCAPPESRTLPDADGDDGSTALLDAYACAGGAAVHAYTLRGGGHTWPGGKQYLPRRFVGPVNRDVDATRAMWTFFVAHPSD